MTTPQTTADNIRLRVLEHTLANNGGYLSQACSAAEQLAVLYGGSVRLAPLADDGVESVGPSGREPHHS